MPVCRQDRNRNELPGTSKMGVNIKPFSNFMTIVTFKRIDQRKKRLKFK